MASEYEIMKAQKDRYMERDRKHTVETSPEMKAARERIADLERQLAEATQRRSPETAPRDGTIVGAIMLFGAPRREWAFSVCYEQGKWCEVAGDGNTFPDEDMVAWFPLRETKKEDV